MPSCVEEAGLFVANQLTAGIGHALILALGELPANPEAVPSSCRRFPIDRGCPGFSVGYLSQEAEYV